VNLAYNRLHFTNEIAIFCLKTSLNNRIIILWILVTTDYISQLWTISTSPTCQKWRPYKRHDSL